MLFEIMGSFQITNLMHNSFICQQSALHPHTVRLLTEGDDTRGCGDTIGPPEDEQRLLETC